MTPTPSYPATSPEKKRRPSPRPSPWVWPLALALALAAYHVWDFAFHPGGTGLRVALVSREETKAALARDPRAIVLDVRLHGDTSPFPRTVRVPRMQLRERLRELDRYRRARVFVLGASDSQGIEAAALLARRSFTRVACVRSPATARARLKGASPLRRALTSKDGLISLNENAKAP